MRMRTPADGRALIWSYGGGVQSVAIAALIVAGELPRPECVVMADTGREGSATWAYLREHVTPLLARVGLSVEIAGHDLSTVDLYSKGAAADLLMPVFTQTGKLETFCSTEWKARVVQRFLRARGYGPERPVRTWIGISLDEATRVRRAALRWQALGYPLIGDYPATRGDCVKIIERAGLPPAPKSSCWCCPHRQNEQWADLKANSPVDWTAAVALDKEIRAADGGGGVFLHFSRVPLDEADLSIPAPADLPLLEGCDSGYCWT